MRRCFLAVLAVGVAACAAAARQPPTAPQTGESQSVLDELGLTAVPGLPTKLPEEYRPDLITEGDVRKDQKRYPVRAAVLDAVAALRDSWGLRMSEVFPESDYNPRGKEKIAVRQEVTAKTAAALRAALSGLDAAAPRRVDEKSKRWQAHFDYIRSRAKRRVAEVEEYYQMLDQIRRDELPGLNKEKGQNGWRLAPADKSASAKDVRQLADDARAGLTAVAKDHPKTTWAALAEKDLEAKPGLRWEPTVIEPPKKEQKK
jgi:hypothetical protein